MIPGVCNNRANPLGKQGCKFSEADEIAERLAKHQSAESQDDQACEDEVGQKNCVANLSSLAIFYIRSLGKPGNTVPSCVKNTS